MNQNPSIPAPKSVEVRNKAVVERYFREVIDRQDFALMAELMVPDVVLHRPAYEVHGVDAAVLRWRAISKDFSAVSSEILDMVAEGDMVTVRVFHRTRMRPHTFRSRGVAVTLREEQEVSWGAMVQHRIRDGRIAEEWVMRDELGILTQMGQIVVER